MTEFNLIDQINDRKQEDNMKKTDKFDDTLIIVPAYNESQVIKKNLSELLKYFSYVVCIDDGSPDNTAKEISKTKAILISHPVNLGQGGAIQTGIEYGIFHNFPFMATFDADGQHSIDDLKLMIRKMRKEPNLDIILGSRFLNKKPENMSLSKKLLLKLAVGFSNFTSRLSLTDTHNGLRVFNLKTAKLLDIQMCDYSHASEILDKIHQHSLNYQEFATTIYYSDYSKAKGQSSINAINILVDQILNIVKGKR